MKKALLTTAILSAALAGCGGGGGGTTTSTSSSSSSATGVSTGYALPTEISAVPADTGTSATGLRMAGLISRLVGVAHSGLPDSSDFKQATTKKYVEERTLEQFSIIETIFNALAQTHYAENVGQGAYKAMVAWEDKEQGRDTKSLQPWVVDSQMVQENGSDVNVVHAWIEEPDPATPGQNRVIYAEFKIYAPAVQSADGSYSDYGEWDINVKLGDTGWFTASARKDSSGKTELKINMEEQDGPAGPATYAVQAIMYRGQDSGYGKVQYPDFTCDQNGCTPTPVAASYAYNTDYLAVNDGSATAYKDRSATTEFVRRYGLFFADADSGSGIAAGDDVLRHKRFGFPFRYTDSSSGLEQFGYYGAWQSRHQIWGGEGALTAGTEVTREDIDPSRPAEIYYASDVFKGTLVKRTMAEASLADVQGVPVEVMLNRHFMLLWDGSQWVHCASGMLDPGEGANPTPSCVDPLDPSQTVGSPTAFTDFAKLQSDPSGRKAVQVQGDGSGGQPAFYVWNDGQSHFEEAQFDPDTGQMSSTGTALTPTDGMTLNVDIWGSIYVEYTGDFTSGTGWVQKSLTGFNEQTWTPEFDPNGDTAFTPELYLGYYLNANGNGYIVRRIDTANDPSSYEVFVELQQAVNPTDAGAFLPTGTAYLSLPWRRELRLSLVTDAASPNFLALVYAQDDPSTPNDDTGQVYTSDEWGLQPYDSSDQPLDADGNVVPVDSSGMPTGSSRPAEFVWEYDASGGWGSQQFLCTTQDCASPSDYVILDDPIQLQNVQVTDSAGNPRSFLLQYDGWLFGLPNPYEDLANNGWTMTADIASKVVNIPDGTQVAGSDGTVYFIRPLEVSVFLNEVTSPANAPDIAQGQAVDLGTVPTFDDPTTRMGSMPTGVTLKYSEGKPVS